MWQTAVRDARVSPISPTLRAAVAAVGLLLVLAVVGCGVATSGAQRNVTRTPPFSAADQARLSAVATAAVSDAAATVQTRFSADRMVTVTVTIGWTSTISINDVDQEQQRVKTICFDIEKALWTSGVASSDALVIVIGPVIGEYGEQSTDAHATAELSAATAASISWASLDPDSAWARYDHVYLRDTYTFSA